jgi:hypothetical protein
MAFARLPINTLSGGVGRQAPTKRLISEAENIDNCLVTLEKSVEKRPPVTQVSTNVGSSYLDVQNITPVLNDLNTDNLYFHFLDIDGYNRYCIIINRAGYPFNPVPYKSFTWNNVTINLSDFITVYRIEPTQWVKETVDNNNITSGFNRGIFEYLTFGNKNSSTSYNLGGVSVGNIPTSTISESFGSIDFDVGLILWNKLVSLDYLTNNYSQDNAENNPSLWYSAFANNQFIHSGDVINYKRTEPPTTPSPILEDSLDPANIGSYWVNVRDDVRFSIDPSTLEEEEEGQSVENFGAVPQTPASEVYNDVRDFNGYRALRMLYDYYDNPRVLSFEKTGVNGLSGTLSSGTTDITSVTATGLQIGMYIRDLEGTDRTVTNIVSTTVTVDGPNFTANTAITQKTFGWVDWSKDYGYLTSPFTAEDRDDASTYLGFGKVYFARNPYLTFPAGFYRATRYSKNPYYERVRSEGPSSVLDHRRFPLIIYKDFADSGKWKIKHMPLFPRRAGTSLSNKGPTAVERKEKIQSMSIWKNRLWVATDNTIFASRSNSFYNFWIDDINNVVETDPIDIQASVGAYNKLSYIVPFQNILFALSSGSVQFEVRGGSTDVGISPFNVEFRPTSFYSTSKLNAPMKLGNNVFFTNSGKMYMYLSGSSFSDEYSTSMDISNHCRNYLPVNIGATATSSAVNTIFMVNKDDTKQVYLFTFRTNGDKIAQNAFHRWIFSTNDQIVAMQSYEKDFYLLSKRVIDNSNNVKLAPYFMSLETVPPSTPMLDWLYLVPTNQMSISGNNTIINVPFRDPNLNYIVKGPAWPTDQRYAATGFTSASISLGTGETTISIPGTFNTHPVYVGRSYEMNVELSQMVYRSSQDSNMVLEGVLNLKRITTKHFNSGSYDIVLERRGRLDNPVTFYPLDLNSIIDNLGALKVDTVGEHFCKVLSYSEACKIFIKSAYPTPCNISNIEITGNFRSFNTSIE